MSTSVSKSVPFLLTRPSPVAPPQTQRAVKDEVRVTGPRCWLTDSRRIECLRWAGKLKSPLLAGSQPCCFTPGLFEGSGSGARCAEENWIAYTCENSLLSEKCVSPTVWSHVPPPSPTFPIWGSISCCVDVRHPESGSRFPFFWFVLNELITANELL